MSQETLPKVSILIPTRNRAGLLAQALGSALAQDYPRLEIIVSDNASEDETPRLAQRCVDPRLVWRRFEANVGLDANWRALLYDYAGGDYVKVLADDDYLVDPAHVSKAVALARETGARAVFAGACVRLEPSGDLAERDWDLPAACGPELWMKRLGCWQGVKVVFPNLVSCAVFRRDDAVRLGAFRDPVFGMDYQLAFQFMLGGPTAYLRGRQCVLRRDTAKGGNDGVNAPLETVLSSLRLYERTLAFGRSQGLPEKQLRHFCRNAAAVLAAGFVAPAWARDRGTGWRSLAALYRTIAAVDAGLARRSLRHPTMLSSLLLGPSSPAFRALYGLYNRLRRSNIGGRL